jgi:hypothetical protein
MRNVIWLVFARFGTVALIVFLLWQGWDYFGPQKPHVPEERQEFAESIFVDVRDDLAANRGAIGSIAVLHLVNDPSDFVTDRLRTVVEEAGIFDLRDRTLGEKFRNALRFRHRCYGEADEAIEEGRERGVDGVLFGAVESFEADSEGTRLEMVISLADVSAGRVVFTQRYTKTDGAGLEPVQKAVRKIGWFKRFLAWAIIVLLLPVFSIAFLRSIVRRRSNKSNAFTLGLYTFVGAALAYLLLGFTLVGFFSILLFLIIVAAVFFYNAAMMSFALRLEED